MQRLVKLSNKKAQNRYIFASKTNNNGQKKSFMFGWREHRKL
jgi:hypothetical protein